MAKSSILPFVIIGGGVAAAYLLWKKNKADDAAPRVPRPEDLPALDPATRNRNWAYGDGVAYGRDSNQLALSGTVGGAPIHQDIPSWVKDPPGWWSQAPGWWPTKVSAPQVCGTVVCPPGTTCVQDASSNACVYPDGSHLDMSRRGGK